MNRKLLVVCAFTFLSLLFNCSNDSNPAGPEQLRLVISNTCDSDTRVFFNTDDQGNLKPGESKLFRLPAGSLAITFRDALLQRTFDVTIQNDTSLLTCGEY